jgi:hypothetical protein
MQKYLLALIFGILMIGLVSAHISISPSELDLANYTNNIIYPGETILVNITITTDENVSVYLNSTSQANIIVNYSTPLVINGAQMVEVQFIIPTGIVLDTYDIYLNASADLSEHPSTSSGGGGSSYVRVVPINTTNTTVTTNIKINSTIIIKNDSVVNGVDTETDTETDENKDTPWIWKLILIVVAAFVVLAAIFMMMKYFVPEATYDE